MEVVAALLQELLILSSILSLLGLLLKRSSAYLSLRALQRCLLRARAEPGKLLGSARTHCKALLPKPAQLLAQLLHSLTICLLCPKANALLLLCRLKSLLIPLLIQRGDSLSLCKALLPAQSLPL